MESPRASGRPNAPTDISDETLVASARAGERWATEALFRRHFPTATRFAARLAPSVDAEDVGQDALVEALRNLGSLAEPKAFAGWLRGIVVRLVSQKQRRFAIARRLGFGPSEHEVDLDALVAPHTPPEVRLELAELYRLLATLPVDERMALALSRIEGMTNDEVAEAMGLSLATVKRRLMAATAKLDAWRRP